VLQKLGSEIPNSSIELRGHVTILRVSIKDIR